MGEMHRGSVIYSQVSSWSWNDRTANKGGRGAARKRDRLARHRGCGFSSKRNRMRIHLEATARTAA